MGEIKPCFDADAAEEHLTNLAVSYRNTGNEIFKKDNEGRHASEQRYSPEYQKYLGMQIAMREVLEYFARFDLSSPLQPIKDAAELQRKFAALGNCYSKKALCDLCVPFRDRYGLTDLQTLRIARKELSLSELLDLLERKEPAACTAI